MSTSDAFRIELGAALPALPAPAAPDGTAAVCWRFLDEHGVEIGRGGVDRMPDQLGGTGCAGGAECTDCTVAVRALQRDVVLLDRRAREVEPGRWRWELRRFGSVLARGSRTFAEPARCELAMMIFVLNFPDAPVVSRTRPTALRSARWTPAQRSSSPARRY